MGRNITKKLKTSAFKAFVSLAKPLWGKGLGKIGPIGRFGKYLYRNVVYRNLSVSEVTLKFHGLNMIVRTSELDGISQQLLFGSDYEQYVTKLFKSLVTGGMTVVDVGANIGYYTLLASSLVGNNGRVFAFEPEQDNYAFLVRNIELNSYKNVVSVRKAVYSKTGLADLFLSRENGAHGFLPDREGVVGVTAVETVSLDEYFKGRECPIDVVKIDVEGAELEVLKGMSNIIRNNDSLRIFTELFWRGWLQEPELLAREYWDKLVESGFKFIYLINEREQKLELVNLSSLVEHCEAIPRDKLLSPNLLCAKSPVEVGSH